LGYYGGFPFVCIAIKGGKVCQHSPPPPRREGRTRAREQGNKSREARGQRGEGKS